MSEIITIELLRPDDKEAIEFCVNYISSAWGYTQEEARSRLSESHFCLVARINNSPIGMVALFPRTKLQTDGTYEPWAAGLYVTEQHRHIGIGQRLQKEMLKQARLKGYPAVYMATDNEPLKLWYHRAGWKVVGKGWENDHTYDVFAFDLKKELNL